LNAIKNNPVTTADIDIAEKIFGPNISTLKGKTTRRKPVPVVEDHINIPRELIAAQHSVTLCIDGMKVNGLSFLTTVSKNLFYRITQYIEKQTTDVYQASLGQVFHTYNAGDFKLQRLDVTMSFVLLWLPLLMNSKLP